MSYITVEDPGEARPRKGDSGGLRQDEKMSGQRGKKDGEQDKEPMAVIEPR